MRQQVPVGGCIQAYHVPADAQVQAGHVSDLSNLILNGVFVYKKHIGDHVDGTAALTVGQNEWDDILERDGIKPSNSAAA